MSQMLFTCNSNGQNVLYFYLLNLAALASKHHKLPHEEPGLPGDMEFTPKPLVPKFLEISARDCFPDILVVRSCHTS